MSSTERSLTETAEVLPDTGELVIPGNISETGLELRENLSFEKWQETGQVLGRIERSCQWWIGDWLNFGERKYGEKYAQAMDDTGLEYSTLNSYRWVSQQVENVRRRTNLSWSHHDAVATLEPDEQDEWLGRAEDEGWTRNELRREIKQPKSLPSPKVPKGKYRCIVIDPPWPVEKIEREVRPKQAAPLDYRTMSIEDIGNLPIAELIEPEGAHVYLWVTHKHLPAGLQILEDWGCRYECELTWRKNVGMTPFSWMYDTEHILFARAGKGLDVQKQGLRLSFDAPVHRHSEKPEVFYERVRAVSPANRLDMFARKAHEGFEAWGNEA